MGRTRLPVSQLIEHERRAWAAFKRALRQADQEVFNRLFDGAKLHVQAGAYLSRPWPFEVIVMAMLLEHHKRLERVLAWIEAVEGRLSGEARDARGPGLSLESPFGSQGVPCRGRDADERRNCCWP